MILKKASVIGFAALLIFSAAGCRSRNQNVPPASVPEPVPPVVSSLPEPSVPVDEFSEDESSLYDRDEDELSGLPGEDESGYESSLHEYSLPEGSEITSESVAAAMSTDFTEIGALDATKVTQFTGGDRDSKNRPSAPLMMQKKYGELGAVFINPVSDKIYLTFDEGYENGYTTRILDTLNEKNVKAVFFVTYPYVKSEPALVHRMIEEGHVVGSHSTAHKIFPEMELEAAAKDLLFLHEFVKANFGYEMWLFRPPEGAFSEQTLALAGSIGYKTVMWSFAYKDYDTADQPLTLEATDRIVSQAHAGEVCLLHAVSKTNAEILGDVIDQIRAKGLDFADTFLFS